MKKFLITIVATIFAFGLVQPLFAADELTCWFPPAWKSKSSEAEAITTALTENSGLQIKPRIAKSYPEILTAFNSKSENLVYVGSFVQSIIAARKLGTQLVQNIDGKELYSGVLILPKGVDPKDVLINTPEQIAFAIGASSGESSAKAATDGKAAIGVANHGAAIAALQAGRAKGAVVKNWWWEARAKEYPDLVMHLIPGVSIALNPDNILTASKAVSKTDQEKIKKAAMASSAAFGKAANIKPCNPGKIAFSLGLMQKGKIDPLLYSW